MAVIRRRRARRKPPRDAQVQAGTAAGRATAGLAGAVEKSVDQLEAWPHLVEAGITPASIYTQPPFGQSEDHLLKTLADVLREGEAAGSVDPFAVRIGDRPLLDFMYSDSVLRRGMLNCISPREFSDRESQFSAMAAMAGGLHQLLGHHSVTYGYISPAMSRRIVSYMDPGKPSHHRFDLGAAADFVFHRPLSELTIANYEGRREHTSTHLMAETICRFLGPILSRVITYSESPGICLATSTEQHLLDKDSLYYNVYQGVPGAKPLFLRDSIACPRKYNEVVREQLLEHGACSAQGWPSYHGKGRRQAQHIRLGKYVLLSDLLRTPQALVDGTRNAVPGSGGTNGAAKISRLRSMGRQLSALIGTYERDFIEARVRPAPFRPKITIAGGMNSRLDLFSRSWARAQGRMDYVENAAAVIAMQESHYSPDVFQQSMDECRMAKHPAEFRPDFSDLVYLLVYEGEA